jgi:hypothetical protein
VHILNWNTIGENMPNDGLIPAKQDIPQWYKDIRVVNMGNLQFNDRNEKVTSVKNCVPYLEALTSGYLATLWTDMYVTKDKHGIPKINWYGGPDPIVTRPITDNVVPKPDNFIDINLGLNSPFMFQAPKGYSALITPPLNRYDLPFTVLSGIVDLDILLSPGVFPFFLKEDFTGHIPIGTPLFQIIPFKRESWKSEKKASMIEEQLKQKSAKDRTLLNWYRHNAWIKKDFS